MFKASLGMVSVPKRQPSCYIVCQREKSFFCFPNGWNVVNVGGTLQNWLHNLIYWSGFRRKVFISRWFM